MFRHLIFKTALFLILALALCCPVMADEQIIKILRAADQSRGNLEGITWNVKVDSLQNGTSTFMTYTVKARGFDILAENLEPAKYKGNKLLMLQGNMWFYKPGLSKPVPISRRQKLLGNAAYGDIAATNYADDYEATPLQDEDVNGEPCHVYDLKSTNMKATYDRIKYWISKKRQVGVRAFYYTVSGKTVKSSAMEYDNKVTINGVERPFISKIIIYDKLMTKDVTTLTLTHPVFASIPDYVFNVNLLRK